MLLAGAEQLQPGEYEDEYAAAQDGRRSLEAYVKAAWHVVEPETDYHENWHVGAICYFLEAVTSGEVRNLLVNVPPGFMKSLLVSVFWPTWEWGPKRLAHLRYLCASNGRELAVRDTLRARRLIQSDWYQRHYGDAFTLMLDQNRKMRFDNDKSGARLAVSVGSGTGERGNRVIFDDPHQLDDADYPDALKVAVDYNNVTLDSRLADRERDSKIVVQQRVATRDVTGDILRKMDEGGRHYEVLCLPMRHDPAYQMTLMGRNVTDWKDPRRVKGELLDPVRYSEKSVRQDEINYGPAAAAILGQKPEAGGNRVFEARYFDRFDAENSQNLGVSYGRYVFFDTAYEAETSESSSKRKKSSDYTAWAVFDLLPDYRVQLIECRMERLEYPELLEKIEEVSARHNLDGKLRDVVVERAASGRSAIQSLAAATETWLHSYIRGFDPGTKSKTGRAKSASLWVRQGCVRLPTPESAAWVHEFTEELFEFPVVEHDDRTDAFVMGVLWLENLLAEGQRMRQMERFNIPDLREPRGV